MANSIGGMFNNFNQTVNANNGSMKDWINKQDIPAEQKNLLRVQADMQRMQELTQLCTTLMKSLHEMTKSVIQNLSV